MTLTKLTRVAVSALTAAVLLGLAGCSGDPFGLMPEAASVEAGEIDELTYLVTYIVGVAFVGVEGLLIWFLFKYRARKGVRATYTHGNHTVEMIWTVAPALILVFLALYQFGMWQELKANTAEDNEGAVDIQVLGKQFEWFFRYPGPDGEFETKDDILTSGQIVVPVNRPTNFIIRSMDVLHSFYLPNFRVKVDAVPGSTTRMWIRPTTLSANRTHLNGEPMMTRAVEGSPSRQIHYWDVVCAELCGNGHTTMAAQLFVVSDEDYENWLAGKESSVSVDQFPYYDDDNTVAFSYWRRQDARLQIPGPPKWDRGPLFWEENKGDSEEEGDDEDDF